MARIPTRTALFFGVIFVTVIVLSLLLLWTDSDTMGFRAVKDQLISTGAFSDLRVVVSISTFGKRTDRIERTVESIFNQTRKPDALYLHIPKELKRIKVDQLVSPIVPVLEKKYDGWLKVTRPEDYGPSTKLLGTLLVEQDPKTIVVTLDDDEIYHKDLILALVHAAEQHPNAAPCFVCEFWPWWSFKPIYAGAGYCHGWGNAFAGIAYRVGFFDETVFDYSLVPDGCRLHDDVYLSGYMSVRGHRPYVVKPGFNSIAEGLSHTNLSINSVKNTESNYRDPCARHYHFLQ
ncbi:hypothetical protein HDU97_001153 [Phlyctochytrium planicorne]|nr:hypothetical protein HDU97_001153 [Phlyctochytrium planicorne]